MPRRFNACRYDDELRRQLARERQEARELADEDEDALPSVWTGDERGEGVEDLIARMEGG